MGVWDVMEDKIVGNKQIKDWEASVLDAFFAWILKSSKTMARIVVGKESIRQYPNMWMTALWNVFRCQHKEQY